MSTSMETRCVHGLGKTYPENSGAITTAIYQTASFSHEDLGHNPSGFDYTRISNPTRKQLEDTVSALEGAADTVAFATGMAAISAAFELFCPGDEILCSADLYGGTVLLFDTVSRKNGLKLTFVDTTDLTQVRAAMTPQTKAIYIETPSNPMMNVTDIRGCAAIGAEFEARLIVDNTFLSPYFQNPLALGADIVIHSGTKYLGGHNDTLSGFVCVAEGELGAKLHILAYTLGSTLAPMDSFLTLRGIKTLAVRMERAQENALALANWLKEQPQVDRVYYVGLPEHPGYAVNAAQSRGAGAMLSFSMKTPALALQVLQKVRLITFAESLGGPESLITLPATQTHKDVAKAEREKLGITDALLRMSVGLENARDLIADLKQAMEG